MSHSDMIMFFVDQFSPIWYLYGLSGTFCSFSFIISVFIISIRFDPVVRNTGISPMTSLDTAGEIPHIPCAAMFV